MSNTLFISLAVLGILGGILAVVLYFVAQRFKVEENPLIDEAEACLPGANCGGWMKRRPVCPAPTAVAVALQAAVPWPKLV